MHDSDEDVVDDDEENEENENEETKKKKKAKKEIDKLRNNQKVGVYGHFLTNKTMIYNPDNDLMEPEKKENQPKKLVDLSIIKKGKNQLTEATSKVRKTDFMKEDIFLNAEEDRLNKAAREAERLKKLEEAKNKD